MVARSCMVILVVMFVCAVEVSHSQMMIRGNNKGYVAAALVTGRSDTTRKELKTNMGRLGFNRPAPPPPTGKKPGRQKKPTLPPPRPRPRPVPSTPPRHGPATPSPPPPPYSY
ncbi:hypothetical protein BVC80_9099g234 [Macleaya cordata]|uniref:Uncharacterized protein n=1 Tax=Macleaya cordata TaxID=56857 RepID=A0A200PW42_MACCD|nr:hypothetical protein BVC80_9099g234 [Macleaya cordata]